ncbi:MAG: hypothetical protein P1U58_10295 [Verrucomicrobiales bacterium]|nr:hypothetical protein [Verrucomicrobiales bacterium]
MPFQPLPDTGPEKPKSSDLGLLLIRVLAATTFFYYQLIDQLVSAKKYIWEKTSWDLMEQLQLKGLHYPGPVAVIIAAALALSFVGLVAGVFTRINALVLLVITGFVFITPLELSSTLNPQSLALYLSLFFAFAVGGAGRLSLDYFMTAKKAKPKNG